MTYIPPIACWGFDDRNSSESYASVSGTTGGRYGGSAYNHGGGTTSKITVSSTLADLSVSAGIIAFAKWSSVGFNTVGDTGYFFGFSQTGGGGDIQVDVFEGHLRILRGSLVLASSATALYEHLPEGSMWHHMELRFKLHPTEGGVALRYNGQEVIPWVDSLATTTSPSSLISGYYLHKRANSTTSRLDDVYLIKDDTGVTADWLGDLRVITQLPGGNGSVNEWVGSDGNSVDNYLLVDEENTATGDYVMTTETGKRDLYTPVPIEGPWEVLGTTIEVAGRKNVSGNAPNLKVVEKYGANEHVSDERPPNNASWAKLGARMRTEAPDGLGWTVAKLNDTEFGVESS